MAALSILRPVDWRLYLSLVLISLAISGWAAYAHFVINPDAVYYLRAAEFFSDGRWLAGFGVYRWPFYSLMIAGLMNIFGLGSYAAAQVANALFDAVAAVSFVALVRRLADNEPRRILLWAAALILLHPRILQLRPVIIRDHGFLAFFLLALYLLAKDVRAPRFWRMVCIAIAVLLATLFRLEALFLLLLIPGFYLFVRFPDTRSRIFVMAGTVVICLMLIPGYFVWIGMDLLDTSSPSSLMLSVVGQASGMFGVIGARAVQLQALLPAGRNVGELVYTGGVVAITIDTVLRAWSFPVAVLALFAFVPRKLMSGYCNAFVCWFAGWQIPLLLTFMTFALFLDWRYAMAFAVVGCIPAVFTLNALTEEWSRGVLRSRVLLPMSVLALVVSFVAAFPRTSQLGHLLEAARWAELHVSATAKAVTNDPRIAYLSHRSFDDDIAVRTLDALSQSLQQYDYAIVAIDKGQPPTDLTRNQPVVTFRGIGASRVMIYKLR